MSSTPLKMSNIFFIELLVNIVLYFFYKIQLNIFAHTVGSYKARATANQITRNMPVHAVAMWWSQEIKSGLCQFLLVNTCSGAPQFEVWQNLLFSNV
jgi:hypothetical protein